MKIPNVKNLAFSPLLNTFKSAICPVKISFMGDSFSYNSGENFDKSVLTDRGIIPKDKDLF